MKKILASFLLLSLSFSSAFALGSSEIAANFLAEKGVINNNSGNESAYNVGMNITRREMLKVMMNLSGKTVGTSCAGKFGDMKSSDWGCKYAEAALTNGYIAANTTFRPNDNVTQIEALKMIMQAKGLERDENADWRAGYVSKALSEGILDSSIFYDDLAVRGWIFVSGARTYNDAPELVDDTSYNGEEIPQEIQDLLDYFLGGEF